MNNNAQAILSHADEIARLRAVMDRCVKIVERNLHRQNEKVEDVPMLLRAALSPSPAPTIDTANVFAVADKLARRMGGRFVPHEVAPTSEAWPDDLEAGNRDCLDRGGAEPLRDALGRLLSAAQQVRACGNQMGPQWLKLNAAIVHSQGVLANWKPDKGENVPIYGTSDSPPANEVKAPE